MWELLNRKLNMQKIEKKKILRKEGITKLKKTNMF